MSEELCSGIGTNLELPDHTEHLKKANDEFEKIKKFYKTNPLNDKNFIYIYEQTAYILCYVGDLSTEVFNVHDYLEEEYLMKYLHSPVLGKELFWKHYEDLHRPYTLIKNRCFRMFEDLDEQYIRMYNKYPPNWNI